MESDDEEAPPVVKEVKPKKVEIVVEPVEPKSIGYSQNQLESAIYKALSLENENRKVRKAEKKKLKEEAPPVVKEVKPKKVEIVVEPVEPKSIGYSQNQLESAIYKALSLENENRKVRKAEKKKLKEEAEHKQKIFNTVQKAVNPQEEMWANCLRE